MISTSFNAYNNGMNEQEKMLKLCDYGVSYNENEDRACVAVSFAWSWSDFSVETDGECRPGHIIFKPTDREQISVFMNVFVPALNEELKMHGYRELTQYGSGEYYHDLDDPEDLPSLMEMMKFLRGHGIKYESFAAAREVGKVAMAAKVRELNGSRYFHFDTFGKLVTIRDSNGRISS